MFLTSIQSLDLYIAFIPHKIDDIVDSLIIHGLYCTPVGLRIYVRIPLSSKMKVDSVFAESKGYKFSFFILLFLLFFADLFFFPRRQNYLITSKLSLLLFYH